MKIKKLLLQVRGLKNSHNSGAFFNGGLPSGRFYFQNLGSKAKFENLM